MTVPALRARAPAALALGAMLALTCALYLPALSGPLLLDDYAVIAPLLRQDAFDSSWQELLFTATGPFGRPLAQASFIANALAGGDDLRAWKAVNLSLHCAIGMALYALIVALGRGTDMALQRARALAVCVAAIWLIHPLHVSTVMYTVQRMTQLATLFSVLGMLLYARGRMAPSRHGRPAILCAFFVCTPLAALAKETGLLLPYLLAALELTVFSRGEWPRPPWLKLVFVLGAGLPALLAMVYLVSEPARYLLRAYAIRDFTPLERVLTEARVLVGYLAWIVLPSNRALGFFHDDVRISHALFGEWDTAGAMLALAVLAGAAWWWRRRAPLAAFGVAVFFIGHALESSVFGLELAFEHRNYLPSAGIILALAGVAAALPPRAALASAAGVIILFSAVTAARTSTWGDAGRLYQSFVAASPASPRARMLLAEWYAVQGAFDAALAVEDGVPGPLPALHRLRVLCARDGVADADAGQVLAAVAATPVLEEVAVDTLTWLTEAAEQGDCALPGAALAAALDTALTRPLRVTRRYRLAIAAARLRYSQGQQADARARLERAAALAPHDPFPWYLAAEWAIDAGEHAAAARLLDEAARRDTRRRYSAMDAALRALLAP